MISDQELIVIGAGYGRTGTLSLKHALSYLLNGQCLHMEDVLANPGSHATFWMNAINQQGHLSTSEWRHYFSTRNYVASVDLPSVAFYRELMEVYPQAKVILTVRDVDSWVRSIRQTLVKKELYSAPMKELLKFLLKITPLRDLVPLTEKMYDYTVGPNWRDFTDEQWREFFIRWNEEVQQHVPKERLLVFRLQEGWKPLCEFLNLPEPPPEVPFPKVNDVAEFQNRVKGVKSRIYWFTGGIMLVAGAALFGAGAWLWRVVPRSTYY